MSAILTDLKQEYQVSALNVNRLLGKQTRKKTFYPSCLQIHVARLIDTPNQTEMLLFFGTIIVIVFVITKSMGKPLLLFRQVYLYGTFQQEGGSKCFKLYVKKNKTKRKIKHYGGKAEKEKLQSRPE